jgi:prepilin signal peptidase PulO-like enzyme (type II secretory pathway)
MLGLWRHRIRCLEKLISGGRAVDEEKKGGRASTISIPVLLLISALAGSLFLGPSPLIPSRPEGTKRNMTGTLGTQDVEARLWQDPFEALELAGVTAAQRKQDVDVAVPGRLKLTWKATASVADDHDIEQLARQINAHYLDWNPKATGYPNPTIALNKQVQVILAMVSGGPYPEDVESRIRSRVAVMAALGTAGYRSEDEEQIGYVTSNWPLRIIRDDLDSLRADGWSRLVLPYEWFTRRIHHADSTQSITSKSNHVLVLWLRDDMFADEPLYRLNELIGYFRHNERDDRLKISILGPRTSTTLRAFFSLNEWDYPSAPDDEDLAGVMQRQVVGSSGDGDWLKKTAMFSWAATTMQGLLVPHGERQDATESQIQRRLKTLGINFFNVTCTDDALASALLAELARRKVDPGEGQNHIALISEWDTFYGRTMPMTFAYKLEQLYPDPLPNLFQRLRFEQGKHSGQQLHKFSYLQGIDGKLPPHSPQVPSEPKTGSESAKAKERKTPEANRAEGPSQLDYIPRLADHIAQENRKLFIGSPWAKNSVAIRAIGILGSDLYDKLLALQALRPRFPNAIFFTTDLDARLWHPDQLKWTRNMVVASSFGLELQPQLQQDIPPFRDSYQTAEYLACLSALGVVSPETLKGISPRLFEIGRKGAVDLSSRPGATPAELSLPKAFSTEWQSLKNPPPDDPIYPRTRMRLSWDWTKRVVLWLAISGALALLLLVRVSPLLRRFITERKQALRREIFVKADDIRDETKLVTSLRKWFPGSLWEHFLSDKFKKALGLSPPQASPTSSLGLKHGARITIIDGLNKLIEWQVLPAMTTAALPVSDAADSKPRTVPKLSVKKDWLRMTQNRRTIEEAAPGALFSFAYPFALTRRSLSNFARFGWIAPAAMLLVLLLAVMDNQASGEGEPFSWTDGVSVWPGQFIRLLAVALSITFILRGEEDLRRNQLELSRHFMLPDGNEDKWPRGKGISDWLHFSAGVRAKDLWLEYRWLGRRTQRAKRIIIMSAFYFFSLFSLAYAFGDMQPMPIRGVICFALNFFLLMMAVITTILLNFFVVDATRLCQRFIQNLSDAPTIYPQATLRKFCGGIEPAADDDLDEWLDMQIIAGRSAEVSKLIYYPFITLLLLIAARAGYWDNWAWQPLLILIFALNTAWAVSSAFVLQRSAKQAKARALKSVRQKLSRLPEKGSEPRIKRLNKIQEDISAMNSGAFAGYLNNPILGALSLPVIGTAVALAIDFLTNG